MNQWPLEIEMQLQFGGRDNKSSKITSRATRYLTLYKEQQKQLQWKTKVGTYAKNKFGESSNS